MTFQANSATATLSIPTSNDMVDEEDGSVTARLLRPPIGCTDDSHCYEIGEYEGTPWEVRSVTTAVTDNDYVPPPVFVADATGKENGGTIEFTVSLERPNHEEASSVDWATREDGTDQAATSGTDFTAASGTPNFAVGETEKTFRVALLNDDMDENHETFNIVLSNPSELTLGTGTATGTILDDELAFAVVFSLLSHDPMVEGEELVLRMQRLAPANPGQTVSVDDPCYQQSIFTCFDADASVGTDPLTINVRVTQEGDVISGTFPTTATFAPGSKYAYLTIQTDDDLTVEDHGLVQVKILNGSGYAPLFVGLAEHPDDYLPTHIRTVYDNDLTFSVGDAAAGEDAGTLDFTVSLNGPAPRDLTVDAATVDGDATSHASVTTTSLGQDFTALSQTLAFLKGEQATTFSVPLVNDSIQERDETFSVQLSNPPEHSTLADSAGVGTIVDDEQPIMATVSRTYSTVDEGQAGPVMYLVELSHTDTVASEQDIAVGWQVTAGTATEGEDYLAAGGTYNFPAGTTSGFLDVSLVDDNLFEVELETFTVELIPQGTSLTTLSTTGAAVETSIRDNETLTELITADTGAVAEGHVAVFRATLFGDLTAQATSVQFGALGDATAGEDYGIPYGSLTIPAGDLTGTSGTLEILAGESSGIINYPILLDSLDEENETLEVKLFGVSSGQRTVPIAPTLSTATATILDGDALTVSVEGDTRVDEGSTATFTVHLSTESSQEVTADWSTRQAGEMLSPDETAKPGVDYAVSTGTVTIPAGDLSATFTVTTTEDTLAEGDESFRVALGEPRAGTEKLPLEAAEALVTIVDNDSAPDGLTVSVAPARMNEGAGATKIDVTVTLDGTTQLTIDTPVTIEFLDRPNATLGDDYTATTANVVVPAGQSSVTTFVTLTPVDDNIAEDDENAWLVARSSALTGNDELGIVIEDNDTPPGEVALSVLPNILYETSGMTPLNVTASLVGQAVRLADTVVIVTASSGTATVGDDFEAATVTLTIPAGEMSAVGALDFTVLEDSALEGDEALEISGDTPGLTVTGAALTIKDVYSAPTSIVLSVPATPISEGAAVSLPVKATLIGGDARGEDTVVDLSLMDVTAMVTDDYTIAWSTTTLTIPAGDLSGSVTLTITPVQDTLHEGPEYLAVRGKNTVPGLPVNGVTLTIEDDDPEPTTIRLSVSDRMVSKGAGTLSSEVTATLEGDSTLNEDVRIDTNVVSVGLDSLGVKSRSAGGSLLSPLVIAAGKSEASSTILLSVLNDNIDGPDETVEIRGTASNPDLEVAADEVIITDDDTAGVTIPITDVTVIEGSQQSYEISLNSEPTSNVTVTANLPVDAGFTVIPGVIIFTPESWDAKYVYVTGSQDEDGEDEPAATITHSVASDDALYQDAAADSVSVTVRDNDTAVDVSFGQAAYAVAEGASITVKVTLSVDPERTVEIPLIKTHQDGASVDDHSGVPPSVTFNSGETEKSFTFSATDDTVDDDGESVKLAFGTLPAGASAGANAETIVSITDDDVPSVTVSFGQAAYTVDEGGTVEVKVTRSADPEREVIVPLTTADQGRATDADYSGVPASVTFNSVDTEKSFTFSATDDGATDDGESVKLTLGTLPTGASAGATAETTVSITDGNGPEVTVNFGQAAYTVEEGGTVEVMVTLSADPEREVIVPLITADQGGAESDYYSGVPASVIFGSGETEQTFAFTAAVDEAEDDGEQVLLGFGSLPYGVNSDGVDQATVTILDPLRIAYSESMYNAEEGGDGATVMVKLSRAATERIRIPITAEGADGATPDDWIGVPAMLFFDPGEISKTFLVMAYGDDVEDNGEMVLLAFGVLPDGVVRGDPATATILLMNMEHGTPTVPQTCDNQANKIIILEPVYNLLRISAAKARTTICRLVLSSLSQFFQRRRHFSSQPKDRSTTQRFGSTAKVCSSLRLTTSTEAPNRFCTAAANDFPL